MIRLALLLKEVPLSFKGEGERDEVLNLM